MIMDGKNVDNKQWYLKIFHVFFSKQQNKAVKHITTFYSEG